MQKLEHKWLTAMLFASLFKCNQVIPRNSPKTWVHWALSNTYGNDNSKRVNCNNNNRTVTEFYCNKRITVPFNTNWYPVKAQATHYWYIYYGLFKLRNIILTHISGLLTGKVSEWQGWRLFPGHVDVTKVSVHEMAKFPSLSKMTTGRAGLHHLQ